MREDRATGKPKGFAFVTFEHEESASRAIASMHNYSHAGRTLTVNRASIRGSEGGGDKTGVDNSWKTVPIPAPSQRSKSAKSSNSKTNNGTNNKDTKVRATWDHWAGPVVKPATVPVNAASGALNDGVGSK